MKCRINLSNVWKLYPKPVQADVLNGKKEYCVLGAVGRYVNRYLHPKNLNINSFPDPDDDGARLLMYLNPKLSEEMAIAYANDITSANDDGYFGEAKDFVEEALVTVPDVEDMEDDDEDEEE